MKFLRFVRLCAFLCSGSLDAGRAEPVDTLIFGDEASEKAHSLTFATQASEVTDGGLGEKARWLAAPEAGGWQGAAMEFDLAVDPQKPNYLTVKLWGGEVNRNLLILSCDGKQIGYRHLGDVEILDLGAEAPQWPGRFCYRTLPLPTATTSGKTRLRCEIRATGPIGSYGATFEQYQRPMRERSRSIYRLSSHTEPCFTPDPEEKQGTAPLSAGPVSTPGAEVMEAVKKRCSAECERNLRRKELDQLQLWFMTRAWRVKWTPAFQNPKVPELTVAAVDALWRKFRANRDFAKADPVVYNSDWFGMALAAESVWLVHEALGPKLDESIAEASGNGVRRRDAWADLFTTSREWLRTHRRSYTNQTMIVDLNIQRLNRCLGKIAPDRALPTAVTIRYLREAVGLDPWLGPETPDGPARPLGERYFQLTKKGLTRELGYVGTYGEVQDWVTQIYDATRPQPGEAGDPDIAAQLAKIVSARAIFRHPAVDADGHPLMRLETAVGWRDVHFPGPPSYGQRASFDAGMFGVTAALKREPFIGWSQQALNDGQFFPAVAHQLEDRGLRVTTGLLDTPDEYNWLKTQPSTNQHLPMTAGMPDFAWADEENGVVALKNGDDIFYASLYWRARHGVNRLAKVHWLAPQFSREAVVRTTVQFEPGGTVYRRPKDWTNAAFGNGLFRYPGRPESAHGGEELPIAKIPEGIPFKPGQENAFAGRCDLYELRYGPWWIAMNASEGKTLTIKVPSDLPRDARDLVQGNSRPKGENLTLLPGSTVIFRLAK